MHSLFRYQTHCLYLYSAKFKESLAEFAKLFQNFPAIGAFVLELPSLKQWHALDMADHIPADHCLRALIPKLKYVKDLDAEQVGGWHVLRCCM